MKIENFPKTVQRQEVKEKFLQHVIYRIQKKKAHAHRKLDVCLYLSALFLICVHCIADLYQKS